MLIMCCSCLLYVVHCSFSVVRVCKLLTAHHVWCMLENYLGLVMCCSWLHSYLLNVFICSLCVHHMCCMLLTDHYVYVPRVCSNMLYVAHCSLCIGYVYFMFAHCSLSVTHICYVMLTTHCMWDSYVCYMLISTYRSHILCVACLLH